MTQNPPKSRELLWEEDFSRFERIFKGDFVKKQIEKRREQVELLQQEDRKNAVDEFERLKEATTIEDNADYQPWIDVPDLREARKKVEEVYEEDEWIRDAIKRKVITLIASYVMTWKISPESELWRWFDKWWELLEDEDLLTSKEFHDELAAIVKKTEVKGLLPVWVFEEKADKVTVSEVIDEQRELYREHIVKWYEELLYLVIQFDKMSHPDAVKAQFDKIVETYHWDIDAEERTTPATDRVLTLDGKEYIEKYSIRYAEQEKKIQLVAKKLAKVWEDAHKFSIEAEVEQWWGVEKMLSVLIGKIETEELNNDMIEMMNEDDLLNTERNLDKMKKKLWWAKDTLEKHKWHIERESEWLRKILAEQLEDYKEWRKWLIWVTRWILNKVKNLVETDAYREDIMNYEKDITQEWEGLLVASNTCEDKISTLTDLIEKEFSVREDIVRLKKERKDLDEWRKIIPVDYKWPEDVDIFSLSEDQLYQYAIKTEKARQEVKKLYENRYVLYGEREHLWIGEAMEYLSRMWEAKPEGLLFNVHKHLQHKLNFYADKIKTVKNFLLTKEKNQTTDRIQEIQHKEISLSLHARNDFKKLLLTWSDYSSYMKFRIVKSLWDTRFFEEYTHDEKKDLLVSFSNDISDFSLTDRSTILKAIIWWSTAVNELADFYRNHSSSYKTKKLWDLLMLWIDIGEEDRKHLRNSLLKLDGGYLFNDFYMSDISLFIEKGLFDWLSMEEKKSYGEEIIKKSSTNSKWIKHGVVPLYKLWFFDMYSVEEKKWLIKRMENEEVSYRLITALLTEWFFDELSRWYKADFARNILNKALAASKNFWRPDRRLPTLIRTWIFKNLDLDEQKELVDSITERLSPASISTSQNSDALVESGLVLSKKVKIGIVERAIRHCENEDLSSRYSIERLHTLWFFNDFSREEKRNLIEFGLKDLKRITYLRKTWLPVLFKNWFNDIYTLEEKTAHRNSFLARGKEDHRWVEHWLPCLLDAGIYDTSSEEEMRDYFQISLDNVVRWDSRSWLLYVIPALLRAWVETTPEEKKLLWKHIEKIILDGKIFNAKILDELISWDFFDEYSTDEKKIFAEAVIEDKDWNIRYQDQVVWLLLKAWFCDGFNDFERTVFVQNALKKAKKSESRWQYVLTALYKIGWI